MYIVSMTIDNRRTLHNHNHRLLNHSKADGDESNTPRGRNQGDKPWKDFDGVYVARLEGGVLPTLAGMEAKGEAEERSPHWVFPPCWAHSSLLFVFVKPTLDRIIEEYLLGLPECYIA